MTQQRCHTKQPQSVVGAQGTELRKASHQKGHLNCPEGKRGERKGHSRQRGQCEQKSGSKRAENSRRQSWLVPEMMVPSTMTSN